MYHHALPAATAPISDRVRPEPEYRDVGARRCVTLGQNLYASTSEPTPSDVVASWVSEASSYDYASNACAAGAVCGHYTQVVWRSSTGLGSATQVCTTGSPFGSGTWWNVVCDYAPPGNWIGQRPY